MLHLAPIWARLTCGACTRPFMGNARTVPNFRDTPACPGCWQKLNELRERLGLPAWDTPADAYPPDPSER